MLNGFQLERKILIKHRRIVPPSDGHKISCPNPEPNIGTGNRLSSSRPNQVLWMQISNGWF